MDKKTKQIALKGLLTALALIFSYIEFLIPIPLPIPGIKLGLANSATLAVFFLLGPVYALSVGIIRIVLSAILFGNFFSLIFSSAGFILSFFSLYILSRFKCFSMIGISISSAIFHNVGQVIMAAFITSSIGVLTYLPLLTVSALVTGSLVGIAAQIIYSRIKKYDFIS